MSSISTSDPVYPLGAFKYLNKRVRLVLRAGSKVDKLVQGWLYTIDPVSLW